MPRAAAIQPSVVIGDVDANLATCERLAGEAGRAGAEIVVLPEFFTSGMAFDDRVGAAALPQDGPALGLLRDRATRHGAITAGSFLCRGEDGDVRNAWFVVSADGVVARHDKDLPTMWENAFYVGGKPGDDGVLALPDGTRTGVAMCWELIRSQTVRRLRGRVDLVLGGSAWWSVPPWPPAAVFRRLEAANARNAAESVPGFARLVGAPLVHASWTGELACPMPWWPQRYSGHYVGQTAIVDARGRVVAGRDARDGEGVVIADVEPGAVSDPPPLTDDFWLVDRGPMAALAWTYQRAHGKRHYRRQATATAGAR